MISQKGKVSMSSMKSSSKVARETLDAIYNEAFNEIIEKLRDRPGEILIARMLDNEYYSKKRAVLSKDGLHATVVKFSGVPKIEMMTILLEARRQTPLCTPGNRGSAPESRQVPPAPWRRASLHLHGQLVVERPVAREVPLPTSPQGCHGAQDGFCASQCFVAHQCRGSLVSKIIGRTRIHCNLNSQSVPIPEDFTVRVQGDFTITNNWSMYDARLKGQRADQSILELFVDSGMDVEFTRDAKAFMKDFIDVCHDECAESMHTCLSGMSQEEKSLLDDGQMSIK